MKYTIKILSGFLAVIAAPVALADNFSQLSRSILQNNAEIKAEVQRGRADVEAAKAENVLAQPEVEFEHMWNAGEGDNRWSVGVSQSFDWPGLYGARRALAADREALATLNRQALELSTREDIDEALINYIAATKRVEMLREVSGLLQKLETSVRQAFEHGESTILDVNKAVIESANTTARLLEAENRQADALASLRALGLEASDSALMSRLETLEFPVSETRPDEDYDSALERHPAMLKAEAEIRTARLEEQLASKTRLPGFSLGYRHAFEDGKHFNGLSVGLELPIWSRRHSVEASKANTLAASFSKISTETSLRAELGRKLVRSVLLCEQIAALAPAVDGTNNMLLLEKAYKGGQMSLLDYLRECAYFLDARMQLLDLQSEYASVTVALNAILERADTLK